MANVRLWNTTYNSTPAVELPTSTGGTATFYEESGTLSVTQNGTHDCSGYANVNVNVSGGSSKNVQIAQSTSRASSSSYTKLASLTCSTTGTYDVYWTITRTSTSGTWGSQLYLADSSYGDVQATFSNHIGNVHLTSVSITKNQEVAVYARSRGSNYYAYVSNLIIIEN